MPTEMFNHLQGPAIARARRIMKKWHQSLRTSQTIGHIEGQILLLDRSIDETRPIELAVTAIYIGSWIQQFSNATLLRQYSKSKRERNSGQKVQVFLGGGPVRFPDPQDQYTVADRPGFDFSNKKVYKGSNFYKKILLRRTKTINPARRGGHNGVRYRNIPRVRPHNWDA